MIEGSPTAETTVPGAGPHGTHPAIELSERARKEVLVAVLLALLLGALDQTIVGVALPRILTDLKGNDLYTWTVTIYLLTSTISGPFYGKLSDIYGRKPLLMFGVSLFLVGSALCGLSQEMWQLILFRGIQGLGAGALFPISLAVIGDLYTPAERGRYQGLFGAVFGVAALVGPALGGFLTDNIGWHAIFYINIPIGLVSLAVIYRVLPSVRRPVIRHRLDYLGGALFTAAITPILVGLTNASSGNWADFWTGGLILIGLALLVAFVWVESRAAEPIIPIDLFRDRSYSATIAAVFFAAFGFFAAIVFLPLFFQVVRQESATISGYETFTLLVGVIGGSIVSGLIVARTGKYKVLLLVSLVLVIFGSFLMTTMTAGMDIWLLRLYMLILGIGIGPTLAVFTIVIQNSVPFSKLGVATSSLTFFRQIGGSVGLAVAGSFFASQLAAFIPARLVANGIPPQFASLGSSFDRNSLGAGVDLAVVLKGAGIPAESIPVVVQSIYEGMTLAIGSVFWLGVGSGIIALAATFLLREIPLRSGPIPARAAGPDGPERAPAGAMPAGAGAIPAGAGPAGPGVLSEGPAAFAEGSAPPADARARTE